MITFQFLLKPRLIEIKLKKIRNEMWRVKMHKLAYVFISEWVKIKEGGLTSVACRWGQEIERKKRNNNMYFRSLWSKRWNKATIGSFKLFNISICAQETYIQCCKRNFECDASQKYHTLHELNCALGKC